MCGGCLSSLTGPLCLYPLLNKQLQGATEEVISLLLVLKVFGHMDQRVHHRLVDVTAMCFKKINIL